MVSFWPWRGEDSSPEGFEKALSALAVKITESQTQLDRVRSKSRRVRVLSTLYLGFAYAAYTVVILLVLGHEGMGLWEWTGMAGGPPIIFAIRKTIRVFFDYRITALENRLDYYQEERAKTIQRLKDATKYDSTLQLLQKYGEPEKRPASEHGERERRDGSRERPRTPAASSAPSRTGLPPPPTANIARPTTPLSRPASASGSGQGSAPFHAHGPIPRLHVHQPPEFAADLTADFAANPLLAPAAVPLLGPRQFEPAAPHWYDRILDLLMGEDETSAKNRIVLICWKCRLVNGQAPPGTKQLSEVGHWRCKECKAMNGEADQGKKLVSEVLKSGEGGGVPKQKGSGGKSGGGDDAADEGDRRDSVQAAKEAKEAKEVEVEVGSDEADEDSKRDGLRKRKTKKAKD